MDTNITDRTTNGAPLSPTASKKAANDVTKGNDDNPTLSPPLVGVNLPPSNAQVQSDDSKGPKQESKGQPLGVVPPPTKESSAATQRRDSKVPAAGISQAKRGASPPAKFGNIAVFVCLAEVFFDSSNFVPRCLTFISKQTKAGST